MNIRKHLPKLVLEELDKIEAEGYVWSHERGTNHIHLLVNGQVVAVIPQSGRGKQEANKRTVLNVRATIRRAVKEMQDASTD